MAPAVEAWRLSHWTAREALSLSDPMVLPFPDIDVITLYVISFSIKHFIWGYL